MALALNNLQKVDMPLNKETYRSWDLYTTGQLVDGLQQRKKTGFH